MSKFGHIALGILGGMALGGQIASAAITISDTSPTIGEFAEVVDPTYPAAGLYVLNVGNSSARYNATDPTPVIGTGFPHSEVAGVYWGVGYRYLGDTIVPSSEGAIGTIDYSIESRNSGFDKTALALMLIQDGKLYRSAFQPVQTQGYEFYGQSGLTALDFGEFEGLAYDYGNRGTNSVPADGRADFTSNPDFSALGGEIQFGYLAHFDPTLAGPETSNVAYNLVRSYSATVNTLPIPEPGSAALAGLGLLAAVSRRRRRA
ncbi:MAG TPA: PEP-CTERM sorting domain-containing protein [Tepidisphaeraceae bacterium]|nr:PEP-CTERM sorting domain-containing protein [Tepidisphaeraceae bacterium]